MPREKLHQHDQEMSSAHMSHLLAELTTLRKELNDTRSAAREEKIRLANVWETRTQKMESQLRCTQQCLSTAIRPFFYVLGGSNASDDETASTLTFGWNGYIWRNCSRLPEEASRVHDCVVADGGIYVFGKNTWFHFDTSGTFEGPRHGHWTFAGRHNRSEERQPLPYAVNRSRNELWIPLASRQVIYYDLKTQSTTVTPRSALEKDDNDDDDEKKSLVWDKLVRFHRVANCPSGGMLAFSDCATVHFSWSNYKNNFKWSLREPDPVARSDFQIAVTIESKVLVLGGFKLADDGKTKVPCDLVEEFDSGTNTWSVARERELSYKKME